MINRAVLGCADTLGFWVASDWAFSEFYIPEWWSDQIIGCIVNVYLRSHIIGREGIVFF